MPERKHGKIWYTAEEAEARGMMPTPEENEADERMFAEFAETVRAARANPPKHAEAPEVVPRRHWDTRSGTEHEGWEYRDGAWYDADGTLIYTKGPDGWYSPDGELIYDHLGNKQQ